MCTREKHEEIKRDRSRWAAETLPIGQVDDGDGGMLELANCIECTSTLAIEMR